MATLLVNCLLVLAFVLLGGLFAASEIALVSLRPGQVRALEETKGARGRAVAALVADENNFLSSVQVGVTLAGFFSASFGAAQISPYVAPLLTGLGLGRTVASTLAFVGVTVVISYLSLVLGELVPKRLAMQSAQAVALTLGPPLTLISRGLRPVIWFLGFSTDGVLRLLGRDPRARSEEMGSEELRGLVAGTAGIGEEERRMAVEVLGVEERRVSEVMTPRTEVVFLDADLPVPDAVAEVLRHPHSRYPVIQESPDDVIGYIHARDLLAPAPHQRYLGDLVRPVVVLPDSKPVIEALGAMREGGDHLALVIDEYGGTDGIVTLEDLIEEFVGEIVDEFDRPEEAVPAGGAATRVSGLLSRAEVRRILGEELPEGAFDTLGGYLAAELGRLPVVGDRAALGAVDLTVSLLDGRRVDRVDVVRRPVDDSPDQRQA